MERTAKPWKRCEIDPSPKGEQWEPRFNAYRPKWKCGNHLKSGAHCDPRHHHITKPLLGSLGPFARAEEVFRLPPHIGEVSIAQLIEHRLRDCPILGHYG